MQMGIFFNAGQVCSATSRLIVHKDIKKQLLAKLKSRAESIRIADPLDAATRLGPIISEQQYNKVMQYIEVSLEVPMPHCCSSCFPSMLPSMPLKLVMGMLCSSMLCSQIFSMHDRST